MQEEKIGNMQADRVELLEKYFRLNPSKEELMHLYAFTYNCNIPTQELILKEVNHGRSQ